MTPSSSAFHSQPAADALNAVGTIRQGLTGGEAAARLAVHGRNRVAPTPPASAWTTLLNQLRGVVVLLLVVATALSLALGDALEAAAIGAVLFLNTAIGFATELRARRAMEGLLQLESLSALVLRDGRLQSLAAEMLVPGDIVRLDAGHRVPADVRLLDSVELRTDEAALTGESLPVSKSAGASLAITTPLADRSTMAYKGTVVVAGSGTGVVTATGASTELGRVGTLVATVAPPRTPLERRLDALGRRLAWITIAIAALVAALAAAQSAPWPIVLQTGIALAVAAVPEALPAVAIIALAVGMRRMARRHALVRRLPAVEALGSTTVVCTDKTRTLTSGIMTVVRLSTRDIDVDVQHREAADEPGVRALLEDAALASEPQPESRTGGGDPVDRAILAAAARAGITRDALLAVTPQAGFVPFSSMRKRMMSFQRVTGGYRVSVKGAPGQVLQLCGSVRSGTETRPLTDVERHRLLAQNESLAAGGLRVLGVAAGAISAPRESDASDLTFLGFIGLADPPAAGVRETIGRLRRAGLRTVMLTGDQRTTAEAVARDLQLLEPGQRIVDATDLDALSDPELHAVLQSAAGFSRVTPDHKLRIVKAWQAKGEIVAMLGDGINDAPALRQADIGVAMGRRGTDVAREAAAIILQDDRFDTIAAAVEEGRTIFDNVQRFVFYLFSCNLAEILVLFVAALLGWGIPLLPLQILWLNIVTDTFPALTLAVEPGDEHAMQRPPRPPNEPLVSGLQWRRIVGYGALLTAPALAAYAIALADGEAKARTVAMTTLAVSQIFHLGNARSDEPVLRWSRAVANPLAIGAVAVSLTLQVLAVTVAPLAAILDLTPLGPWDWVLAVALGGVPAIIGQGVKVRASGYPPRPAFYEVKS